MEKKKKSDIVITILIVVMVAAFLGTVIKIFYDLINTESKGTEAEGKKTEVEQILDKDLDRNYPETPREVVKLYCKITKGVYSEDSSDEEVQKLYVQMRRLFDEELLANNAHQDNYDALLIDIKDYIENKKKIVNYNIQPVREIRTYLYEGIEHALVNVTISVKKNSEWQWINEEFVLRKDGEGRWKILGWKISDTAVSENDEEE